MAGWQTGNLDEYQDTNGSQYRIVKALAAVDSAMGQLRRELRRLGIHRNAMHWFCSDNGGYAPGSQGGLSGRKGNLLEGGIRVPGILEWPAIVPQPFVADVPACTSDFYPTILDLLGIEMPNQPQPLDGISLLPLVDGKMTRRPSRTSPRVFRPQGSAALHPGRAGGGSADELVNSRSLWPAPGQHSARSARRRSRL